MSDDATKAATVVNVTAKVTTPAELLLDHPNFNVAPGAGEMRDFRIVNYAANESRRAGNQLGALD